MTLVLQKQQFLPSWNIAVFRKSYRMQEYGTPLGASTIWTTHIPSYASAEE